ncbi:MAG: hypothetical protein ACRCTF_01900 [Bacteroidales bacterium]
MRNSILKLMLSIPLVCITCSCSNEKAETLTNETTATQGLNTTEATLSYHTDKTFLSLTNEEKKIFENSFMFDENGDVISVILDYKSKGILEEDFLELMTKVLNAPKLSYRTKDGNIEYETKSPTTFNTTPEDAGNQQNPPILIPDSRNNNVGGCDPLKGGTCVIRW